MLQIYFRILLTVALAFICGIHVYRISYLEELSLPTAVSFITINTMQREQEEKENFFFPLDFKSRWCMWKNRTHLSVLLEIMNLITPCCISKQLTHILLVVKPQAHVLINQLSHIHFSVYKVHFSSKSSFKINLHISEVRYIDIVNVFNIKDICYTRPKKKKYIHTEKKEKKNTHTYMFI